MVVRGLVQHAIYNKLPVGLSIASCVDCTIVPETMKHRSKRHKSSHELSNLSINKTMSIAIVNLYFIDQLTEFVTSTRYHLSFGSKPN